MLHTRIKLGRRKRLCCKVCIVRSLINSGNSNRFLRYFSAGAIGLLLIVSPNIALGQSARNSSTHFRLTDTPKVSNSRDSPTEEGIAVDEWLTRERIVFVSGEINPEQVEPVISQLLYLDHQASGKDIYLYINSPGGEITSGLAIYDTIRSLKSEVVTVGVGEVSSMASILLASGTKGKRAMLPHARLMIHQPWSWVNGQASDIAIEAKEILYHRSLLNRLLSELTGQPLKRIETDTDRDFYMSAQDAKTYGIVDQVISQMPSASRPLKN